MSSCRKAPQCSLVAKWTEDADVTLDNEGKQYGDLNETSAIARTQALGGLPAPGGLQKN